MKFNFKYSFFLLLIINVVLAGLILPNLLVDNDQSLPTVRDDQFDERNFDIHSSINGINKDSILSQFPYSKYLKSNNFQDYNKINKDLACLDSIFNDKRFVREQFLGNILTERLHNLKFPIGQPRNLDSLNYALQWAEKFKFYAESDPQIENQTFFKVVFDYWFREISRDLTEYSHVNESNRYNFQFRYLEAKCNENKYNVSVKVSSLEKVIDNFLDKKWTHLYIESWNQSTFLQKLIIAIYLVINFFCYVLTIKYLTKKK
jgi:hypothetical protein